MTSKKTFPTTYLSTTSKSLI